MGVFLAFRYVAVALALALALGVVALFTSLPKIIKKLLFVTLRKCQQDLFKNYTELLKKIMH